MFLKTPFLDFLDSKTKASPFLIKSAGRFCFLKSEIIDRKRRIPYS